MGNCQVAVTSVYADPAVSWPVQVRLYLPGEWTEDRERWATADVPPEVVFQTKPEMALGLIDDADRWQVPYRLIGAEADYGGDSTFLAGREARQKRYVVAVPCDFRVEVHQVYRPVAGQRQPRGWLIGERPGRGHRGYYFANLPETTPWRPRVD